MLRAVAQVPALTWGRDERDTGDKWNSNSVVSWALARAGQDVQAIRLPPHGRAPGWLAGLRVAATTTTA